MERRNKSVVSTWRRNFALMSFTVDHWHERDHRQSVFTFPAKFCNVLVVYKPRFPFHPPFHPVSQFDFILIIIFILRNVYCYFLGLDFFLSLSFFLEFISSRINGGFFAYAFGLISLRAIYTYILA